MCLKWAEWAADCLLWRPFYTADAHIKKRYMFFFLVTDILCVTFFQIVAQGLKCRWVRNAAGLFLWFKGLTSSPESTLIRHIKVSSGTPAEKQATLGSVLRALGTREVAAEMQEPPCFPGDLLLCTHTFFSHCLAWRWGGCPLEEPYSSSLSFLVLYSALLCYYFV